MMMKQTSEQKKKGVLLLLSTPSIVTLLDRPPWPRNDSPELPPCGSENVTSPFESVTPGVSNVKFKKLRSLIGRLSICRSVMVSDCCVFSSFDLRQVFLNQDLLRHRAVFSTASIDCFAQS